MSTNSKFPVLGEPPIIEVVCGVRFESVELDGLLLGVYAEEIRAEFPNGQLLPAYSDTLGVMLGQPPVRAVLSTQDGSYVLQLQHDRFYMNWRATAGVYPRFSGDQGLLKRALAEFDRYAAFCEKRVGTRPLASRVELAKIDSLDGDKHWRDLKDLAELLPVVGILAGSGHSGTRDFALRLVEKDQASELFITVNSLALPEMAGIRAVRIETRALTPVDGQAPAEAFGVANRAVNQAFFNLINEGQLLRFKPEGGTG